MGNNQLKVGDKVKITEFYENQYSKIWVDSHKNIEAEIVSLTCKQVKFQDLDKEDKTLYRSRFGMKEVYDLYSLWIKFPEESGLYLVSQLGFDK